MQDHPQDELEEETSEMSRLFAAVLVSQTEGMDEEDAAAYLAEVLEGGEIEAGQFMAHLASNSEHPYLITSNHPDVAVREASLAPKEQWKTSLEGKLAYLATNALEVYLGSQGKPLEIGEALHTLRQLNESTVLTARIALLLWNSRRSTKMAKNGSVPILLEEILLWQGHEKRSRAAHPQTSSTKRYSDGFRTQQKQRVIQDMAALGACFVRGSCAITVGKRKAVIEVDGPYMRYSLVFRRTQAGEKVLIGFMVAPGDWISTYEQEQAESLAQIDREIFRLNPQNDRYALRLALFLTERWRELAPSGAFSAPIVMADLLSASMIQINKQHLTTVMVPAIEAALARLETMGIVGKQTCLDKVDKQKARWGRDWLAARWEILPPVDLIRTYKPVGRKSRLVRREE